VFSASTALKASFRHRDLPSSTRPSQWPFYEAGKNVFSLDADYAEEYSHEFGVDGLENFGIISHRFHRLHGIYLKKAGKNGLTGSGKAGYNWPSNRR